MISTVRARLALKQLPAVQVRFTPAKVVLLPAARLVSCTQSELWEQVTASTSTWELMPSRSRARPFEVVSIERASTSRVPAPVACTAVWPLVKTSRSGITTMVPALFVAMSKAGASERREPPVPRSTGPESVTPETPAFDSTRIPVPSVAVRALALSKFTEPPERPWTSSRSWLLVAWLTSTLSKSKVPPSRSAASKMRTPVRAGLVTVTLSRLMLPSESPRMWTPWPSLWVTLVLVALTFTVPSTSSKCIPVPVLPPAPESEREVPFKVKVPAG